MQRTVAKQWATQLGCLVMMTVLVSGCDQQDRGTSNSSTSTPHTQSSTPAPAASTAPPWVIDPTEPGTNLPPVGRSLFDFLITKEVNGKKIYDIPFPFSTFVAQIESQLHSKDTAPVLKRLLIPVNRSLQRRASNGAYFTYPRAVLAVDTEVTSTLSLPGMQLKDRLFIGYHEKTGVLEIVSYNEAAGRFEFQIVSDYRAGGTPTVRYANRALCMACHQNQSPIFARPMWDETNVNPKIAALLAHQHRQYHGFPIRQGTGTLQAFDDATDRANDISLAQRLWREGCEQTAHPEQAMTCRAELLTWVLQYGLSRGSIPDWHTTDEKPPSFLAAWRARWPQGLAIPNPDIPNRNPFRYVAVSEFPGLSEVQATALEGREPRSLFRGPYEPTQPREPLEIWSIPDTPQTLERVLATFVQFFTKTDLTRLEQLIQRQPKRLRQAVSALVQDTVLGQTDVLANQPFRRMTVLAALDRQLGGPVVSRCCLDDRGLPPPVDDEMASHHATNESHETAWSSEHKTFHQYCGTCHHGAESFPPNFLHGSPAEVKANLTQCADRIFVRLSMWDVPSQEQLEAPMPPAMHLLHHRISLDQWKHHPDLQTLRQEVVAAIQHTRGATFRPEHLLQQDYDTLPACLAPRHEPTEAMGAQHG
ncbi:MAG: hypothetical protein E8D52_17830 [Nitrospira sp.]|nr:MAG: hypothetical protein E8D52_17830 [Nitrospira sp.]